MKNLYIPLVEELYTPRMNLVEELYTPRMNLVEELHIPPPSQPLQHCAVQYA